MNRYTVHIVPDAWNEAKDLPGHVRQQARRMIANLGANPRPSGSKRLDSADASFELRRIRLDRWRIIYTIVEADAAVDIVAIRKRPPYDYGDLSELISRLN